MTENLAGRGEGLAGLRRWANIGSPNGLMQEHPLGEFILRYEAIAALEAAAPAGTAQEDDDLVQCARCQKMSQVVLLETSFAGEREPLCGPCISVERFAADDAIQAALATPSPQAPTKSVESQVTSSDTAQPERGDGSLGKVSVPQSQSQFKEIPPRSEDLQVFVDDAREQVRKRGIADWVDLRNLLRVIDSMKYEAAIAQRPDVATPGESWRENAAATPAREQSVGRENE